MISNEKVKIQKYDFDIKLELEKIKANDRLIGASVLFVGTVRDISPTEHIYQFKLETYHSLAVKKLNEIRTKAINRWQLNDCIIIHRYGILKAQDNIVLVICASKHRKQAFLACEFVIDILKTQAPFWKKEYLNDQQRWVEPRKIDELASKKWAIQNQIEKAKQVVANNT